MAYVEHKLIRGGGSSGDVPVNDLEAGITADRLSDLNRVVARIQSLATTVSRLPQFLRKFTDAIDTATRTTQ